MRDGTLTSAALTDAYLARIAAHDPHLNAYLTVTADDARAQAAEADRRRAAGEDGPLLGVPFALKDLFTTAGIRTTAGSRMLEGYVPPDDAEPYRRLRAAGAVLLGKLNMDEFAMGSSNESSAFGPARNPWDPGRSPGGSSGGAAAAVAADLCAFALGTDTGGSIRQPAALCGVVGLKPTYGRVSRRGMVAFASSLDQAGPLAKDVRDAALVLDAIAGHDPADATSADRPVPDHAAAVAAAGADLGGLRIGVPAEYFADGLDPAVRAAVEAAVMDLEAAGARRVAISLPHSVYAVAVYYLVATAEASANLARYDGLRYGRAVPDDDLWARYARTRGEGFGLEVKRRIVLGTFALSAGYHDAYYGRATRVRRRIRADFDAALARCDVIVGPTSPTTAFRLGERTGDPLAMYLSDIYTIALNLAGYPGLSVPCGLAGGLPVGLQIMGRPWGEPTVLRVARVYERVAGLRAAERA
ncbi:Asp-tRNA(Asn)/Glu-tRNA(Gln) amidotransferase GatCAB subunit A [bacterium]|nr:MAG: Asp-tRNA(Asn)/Glu-tRNA(Gln) amidotransferase GatCAB subunit A [bacterium]